MEEPFETSTMRRSRRRGAFPDIASRGLSAEAQMSNPFAGDTNHGRHGWSTIYEASFTTTWGRHLWRPYQDRCDTWPCPLGWSRRGLSAEFVDCEEDRTLAGGARRDAARGLPERLGRHMAATAEESLPLRSLLVSL